MSSFRLQHGGVIRFTLVFGVFLVFFLIQPLKFGIAQEQKPKPEYITLTCKNETVKVDPQMGTNPKAIYLCPGYTLTWDPNGHTFVAAFQKKSPFQGGQKVFDNKNYQSKPAVSDSVLTVYSYTMIVDNEPVDDPQVVGGGGH
jgi:hypothetical protein